MNTKKTFKAFLKTLPLLSILTTGLALAPTAIYADNDKGHNKHKYSHNRDKAHNNRNLHRHNKQNYNNSGRSHDKGHKRYNHKPKHHSNNRREHHAHRPHRQPVYIVNDHHYNNHRIDFDRLGFMFGLRTGNFDIIYRD